MDLSIGAAPLPLDAKAPAAASRRVGGDLPDGLQAEAGSFAASSGAAGAVNAPSSGQAITYDRDQVLKNLQAAIEDLNSQLSKSGRALGFSVDEVLGRPIVTVKSTVTGAVIRQIPSEAIVKVAHTLESLKGLLHDATV